MTTPPDFSVGQTLTSAQMNAVGLWLVKSQTVGSGVSSVLVNDAFTSDYDWYRITLSNVTLSSNGRTTIVYCKMAASGTPNSSAEYHWGIPRVDLANGAVSSFYGINQTTGCQVGTGLGDKFGCSFDVGMPKISTRTVFANINCPQDKTGYSGIGSGLHEVTASYDGFQILLNSGTMTGGTIRVYGYRN